MDAITDFISAIVSAPFVCAMWLIVGFAAGALARRVMGSPDRPFCSDIVLGLIGSVVGNIVIGPFLNMDVGGLAQIGVSLVIATGGAIILIFIGNLIFGGARR